MSNKLLVKNEKQKFCQMYFDMEITKEQMIIKRDALNESIKWVQELNDEI